MATNLLGGWRGTARFLVVLGLLACGSDLPVETAPRDTTPANMELRSVLPSSPTVADVIAVTIVVLDRGSKGVPAVTVEWSAAVRQEDGSLTQHGAVVSSSRTDASGSTTVSWTLGHSAREQVLTARLHAVTPLALRVAARPGPVSSLALDRASFSFDAFGDTLTIPATVSDAFGNSIAAAGLAWTSRDPSVATVTSGRLRTEGNGTTRVVLSSGSFRDSAVVSVEQIPSIVTIDPRDLLLVVGDTMTVTPRAFDRNSQPMDVGFEFVAETAGIVSFDADHLARGLSEGQAWVTVRPDPAEFGHGQARFPVAVIDPAPFLLTRVRAAHTHTCGIDGTGSAWCWGSDAQGQIGSGVAETCGAGAACAHFPTRVAVALATMSDSGSCGVDHEGQGYCWGVGFLGDSAFYDAPRRTPVRVSGPRFLRIEGDGTRACGIGVDSLAYCWGSPESPLGTATSNLVPGRVLLDERITDISVGPTHTCAVAEDGDAWCWGESRGGQLGVRIPNANGRPEPVEGGHRFVRVSVADRLSCGLQESGDAYCWGDNLFGRLGAGSTESRIHSDPQRVATPAGVAFAQVAAGGGHACAIATTGALYCWGSDFSGELGINLSADLCDSVTRCTGTPTELPTPERFSHVSLGFAHSCAVALDGATYCWGWAGPHLGHGGFGDVVARPILVDGRFAD